MFYNVYTWISLVSRMLQIRKKAAEPLFSLSLGMSMPSKDHLADITSQVRANTCSVLAYDPLTFCFSGREARIPAPGWEGVEKKEVSWPGVRPLAKMAPHAINSKTSSLVLRTNQGYL